MTARLVALLKAVPDQEAMPVDRVRGTLDRAAAPLLLNPFDGRALATALRLRRPGETVVALSMGPPAVATLLREALAAGVDQAVLISDPALAGSDLVVTAHVLARALERLRPTVIVAGAASTDSGTGLLPPMLAERLGRPAATHARSVSWGEDGAALDVVRDRPPGWERLRVPAEAVLSVGEKVGKPIHPTEEALHRTAAAPVPVWSLADLEIRPSEAGAIGSPSQVVAVLDAAPERRPTVLAEGPIDARVERALADPATADRGPEGRRDVPPASGRGFPAPPEIALLELGPTADDSERTAALAGAVRRWVRPGRLVVYRVRAPRGPADPGATSFAGVTESVDLELAAGAEDPETMARALDAAIPTTRPPAAVLLPADVAEREVAGRLAVRRGWAAVGDVTEFGPAEGGGIVWTKPSFGGAFRARIAVPAGGVVATVQTGALDAPDSGASGDPARTVVAGGAPPRVASLERSAEGNAGDLPLDRARRVVTVGMGIGGPDGIERLRPYLRRWGAALGGTRRVVDAGWLPYDRQVGLTGRAVAPALAVLLGVGKATNHVVGLRRAGRIVAVNPDPTAPVFRYVDFGIVAGWEEVLPALDRALSAPRKAGGSH